QAFNSSGGVYITSSEPSFGGTGKPSYPPSVKVVETTDGNVTISWEAITTDVDGNTIDPDNVLYEIRDNDKALAYKYAGTSLTYDYGNDAKQRFMMFSVRGITDGGTGSFNSYLTPVGRPLDGFTESFPDGQYSTAPEPSVIQYTLSEGAYWDLGHDNLGLFTSQDGDKGFIVMVAKKDNASSAIASPKINLANMTNPGISMWVRGIDNGQNANLNEVYIDICEAGSDTWTELTGKVIGDFTVNGKWSQFGTSLDDFAGKIVQIRIRGIAINYTMIGIDNIVVGSMPGNDLEVKGISAQAAVIPEEDFNIEVTVRNNAIHSSGAYQAVLFADGKPTASVDCKSLDPLQETVITFQSTIDNTINGDPVQYHAVITNSGDENTANNTSGMITVQPLVNRLPRVTDLSATSVNNTVTLTWSRPDITGVTVSEHVAESFEAAESFSRTVDGWIFVDVDDKPIGSVNTLQLPGFTGENVKASFFVMDASDDYPTNKNNMPALTGDKYIASIYAADNSAVDDWAISPELSGHAQIISFSARSSHPSYPETIDVMYSTGGTDPTEFTSLPAMTDIIVPSQWTRYSAGIPKGAKHFAIRSHASNSLVLAIDDIEFESADNHALEAPIGYNVFRDTQLLPDTDISSTTFTDTEVDTGMHSYYITAIYDDGESGISNTASIFTAGINETEVSEIRIASANGVMTISGAMNMPIMVSTIDGRVIFNATAESDSLSIPVAPGTYAVTAGGRSAKIAVR
ncbi:MAG: choice-of-anchor J domain-containing protein, partial [Muribaculaceae bacterium]|nr:choice-of-anchor J domain-containing protein [Muribaculaceae bacterium]